MFDGQTATETVARRVVTMTPLPAQAQFLQSNTRHLAYVGGYGSGKTFVACFKALRLMGRNPGTVGALVAPTYPMMRDTLWKTFSEILDANEFPYEFHKSEWRVSFPEFEAIVLLRSADKPDRLKGLNLSWFILDEAAICDVAAWQVLVSRLRDPGAYQYQGCLTTTPEGLNWVYEEFQEKTRDDYSLIYAPTTENVYLDEAYVQALRDSYDSKMAEQYIDGKFLNVGSGRVYWPFDRRTHVQEAAYDPSAVIHVGLDFNVAPMVAEAFQVKEGQLVGIKEFVIRDNASTQEMAGRIQSAFPSAATSGRLWLYPDAAGGARKTTGKSDHAILRELLPGAIFKVNRSNPAIKDRINAVNGQLQNADGVINLRIHPSQVELRKDFEQVVWNKKGNDIDKTEIKRSHASDAAGYAIQKLRPVRQKAKQIFSLDI